MSKNTLSTCICAIIFILLTGVKLAFPSFAMEASDRLMELIDSDYSFQRAAGIFGEIISDSDESMTAMLSGSDLTEMGEIESQDVQAASEVSRQSSILMPHNYYRLRSLTQQAVLDNAAKQAELEQQRQDAVAAFKQSQEEYAWLELPETVSYEYYELDLEYASPIPGATSSGFGYRLHPIQDVVKFHYGTDFSADQGQEIHSFADGTVLLAEENDSYGKYIIIQHENGCQTLYAHCSELLVSAGDEVSIGQTVALVGSTGLATGPHLHFELKQDGTYLNPEYYTAPDNML